MRWILFLTGLLIHLLPLFAQSQVEDVIEKMLERDEQITDVSEILEDAGLGETNPVNLNLADPEELKKIPGFDERKVRFFLDYRKNYGEILSVNELAAIPGFDSTFLRSIGPYIIIKPLPKTPPITPKNLVKLTRHDLLLRYGQIFPKSKGYVIHDTATSEPAVGYPGYPQRYYFRYTATYFDRLRIGFAGEKDPGEQFFRGAQSMGMDFYSGFISLTNTGWLKNLVIGNFRAGFGQGLTFGTGLSGGTMPGFTPGSITAGSVKGTLSMSEGNYLRGIAATAQFKRFSVTGFFSWHRRDGNITVTDTVTGEAVEVSSMQSSGLHRTEAELEDRNSISELIAGGNVNFTGNFFRIGLTGYYLRWSGLLARQDEPYKLFSLYGKENANFGMDYQIKLRKVYLFGEISRSANGGIAWLAGLVTDPDPRVKITCLVRNYQPGYQNLFSNSFGQQSMNVNEQGLYFNISAGLHSKLSLATYADIYRFPWLKYGINSPSYGFECGIQATSPVTRVFLLSVRFFYIISPISTPGDVPVIPETGEFRRQNLRFMATWNPVPAILLRSRFEVNMTRGGPEGWHSGYLFYQDISLKPERFPASFVLRYAFFNIPGYSQRIYTYEPEVLLGYSVPSFFGNGYRICLLVSGKVTRNLSWWIRGAMTEYHDRDVMGSGLDEITGNKKYELSVQLLLGL
ncbi:MAG: helix-hairpin-helix domain-containing protein [bacterium]